jgi:hypothetical protein
MMINRTALRIALTAVLCMAFISGCSEKQKGTGSGTGGDAGSKDSGSTMRPFGSELELRTHLRQLAEEQKRERRGDSDAKVPAAVAGTQAGALNFGAESVTNVQHAGVDEGGIVKLHGDHLVVLRRGRLFTVAVGDASLRPVSTVDAFGSDIDPRGAWYDEMLIEGDRVIVIGYSYQRGGTEIGLFSIDGAGQLRYQSTYHLRSNDYYSSRNYASRLVGNKLIFYTPLRLALEHDEPLASFPAVRRWRNGALATEFQPIVPATRVYRPAHHTGSYSGLMLHTVTVCDLGPGELACEGSAVVGPAGRVFYVSPSSVYVWVSEWGRGRGSVSTGSMVYRMPLNASAPSALGVSGSPVDQFSFLESEDGHLNVLVRSLANGDGMWSAERARGDTALLRVPLSSFGDGSTSAPVSSYQALPKLEPESYTFQNRFVGNYLLYGTGSGWGRPQTAASSVYAVRWTGGEPVKLPLVHGVDRIEVMGSDAVVVGTDGRDLHFTSVRLGREPGVVSRYTRAGASQGELRSHGFFYKPDSPESGVLGLPVRGPGRPGYEHLFRQSASIVFVRNNGLQLAEVGDLDARAEGTVDDACRASCVDWYGNARPLFIRGRIYALLGYELVEGSFDGGQIKETRRVSFAPVRGQVSR